LRHAFIGGTGRCGTSITRKLLGFSSSVSILPFEHRILIDPDGPIEFLESLNNYIDPFKVDIYIQRMIRHLESLDKSSVVNKTIDNIIVKTALNNVFSMSQYSGWKLSDTFINYREELENFKSFLTAFIYEGKWVGTPSYRFHNKMVYFSSKDKINFTIALKKFYFGIVEKYLKEKNKDYFIEDSTWNITYINSLSEVFNEAKFVHVYRDPRDVVASLLHQRWMPNNVDQVVKIYQDLINDILKKTSQSNNCYNLRFENLIEHKNSEMPKLCSYLDLEYEDSMRNFQLSGGNVGRYKIDFDKKTINKLNEDLSPQLQALQYA